MSRMITKKMRASFKVTMKCRVLYWFRMQYWGFQMENEGVNDFRLTEKSRLFILRRTVK